MKDYFDRFPDSYSESSLRLMQTPSAFARSSFFYVQETGYLKLNKSHVARRKSLDSYLMALVLSGSGSLQYGSSEYALPAGSCFFIDCATPYQHQSSETDPWELLWVHFNGCTSREYHQFFSSASEPAFRPRSFSQLKENLEALLDVNTHSDFTAEVHSSRLIVDLLSTILLEITAPREERPARRQKEPSAGRHPAMQEKMTEIREYLDQHFTEKFSLEALAERFFVSKYHLSREFHKFFGITLNQYISSKRITQAKKLLRFSQHSLEEIARICGFYDASYLNKQFKNSEGISASEFRKKWRGAL